jgi:hypothetical protein
MAWDQMPQIQSMMMGMFLMDYLDKHAKLGRLKSWVLKEGVCQHFSLSFFFASSAPLPLHKKVETPTSLR